MGLSNKLPGTQKGVLVRANQLPICLLSTYWGPCREGVGPVPRPGKLLTPSAIAASGAKLEPCDRPEPAKYSRRKQGGSGHHRSKKHMPPIHVFYRVTEKARKRNR